MKPQTTPPASALARALARAPFSPLESIVFHARNQLSVAACHAPTPAARAALLRATRVMGEFCDRVSMPEFPGAPYVHLYPTTDPYPYRLS